ncbi:MULTISPECIES: hypothetical protein [unclassified Streptomyces]|uniref:hypothetical protein n=1 Tax=unclassified Streptomyces TaxID=2593676 RepID=UPI000AEA5E24|nr:MULTISPECIES: hypothetical protein [unclassified Streptomyces]
MTEAAADVFGTKVRVREIVSEKRGGRYLVTASTDLGDVSGWWPEKELVRVPQVR